MWVTRQQCNTASVSLSLPVSVSFYVSLCVCVCVCVCVSVCCIKNGMNMDQPVKWPFALINNNQKKDY